MDDEDGFMYYYKDKYMDNRYHVCSDYNKSGCKARMTVMVSGKIKMKCKPKAVVCDFEQALHIVRDLSDDSYLIGCLFHWKQAIHRKLVSLRLPVEGIKKAMAPGCLDVLTIVPEKQLHNKGTPYVVRRIKRLANVTDHKDRWDDFWNYFSRTWMGMYPVSSWNISAMSRANVEIVNRTNNPLQAYNRTLADAIGTAHPSMQHLVDALKQESARFLQMQHDIRMKRADSPSHPAAIEYPAVPKFR